jgi:hypothetical protein
MPTNLVEQQTDVDQATLEPARNAAQENVVERKEHKSTGAARKALWQEIFEGHEEFLGLTPD